MISVPPWIPKILSPFMGEGFGPELSRTVKVGVKIRMDYNGKHIAKKTSQQRSALCAMRHAIRLLQAKRSCYEKQRTRRHS
jgi:hypothetical protein